MPSHPMQSSLPPHTPQVSLCTLPKMWVQTPLQSATHPQQLQAPAGIPLPSHTPHSSAVALEYATPSQPAGTGSGSGSGGHGLSLHASVTVELSGAAQVWSAPPCAEATATQNVRVRAPPPHACEQPDQALHDPTQSIGHGASSQPCAHTSNPDGSV